MGNTKHTKEQIRERIQQKKLLFDGAFGTYYGGKYDTRQLPELAKALDCTIDELYQPPEESA